ncbi:cache domain-containing protein [Oxalobacteraceae bacterium]|nr:cache domain-containing protein [Oxalobacteraceae bacterium]
MKQFLTIVAFLAAFSVSGIGSAASDRGSADEAVAMVKKVIADIKKNGKDKVVQEIQNQTPTYKDRDLYITISTLEGMNLANGANPKIAGKNMIDIKDADGKLFQRERIELAKKKGSGWQDYKWPDPITKEIQQKSLYFERYEDVIVGCGIYKK